ncbi:MAG: threonine/serine exporter family protein [Oscillospiraceae bacterium]|nr:threonine/serine exporter family protein [Oscillospiraceae bacterium]
MSKFRNQHMSIEWHDIIDDESSIPAFEASLKEKSSLVGRVGLMMLSVGTGAWRVRASMNKISKALGIVCNADIGLLSIEYTCVDKNGDTYTNALSLSNTGVNTDKLVSIDAFTDEFADKVNKFSIGKFHKILDRINKKKPNYKAINLGLAAALACWGFTFLLGGGPVEMFLAFFGAGVGQFVRKKLIEHKITLLGNVSVSVAAACCTYIILMKVCEAVFGIASVHQAGYICAMLYVIPGFPLITGGIDLAKLDLRSGMERILYACLIIITATVTGWIVALCFNYKPADFVDLEINPALRLVIRLITSFCGVYGFSFLFNSKRRMAVTAGMIGMIANTFRLEIIDFTNIPVAAAAFLGALISGLLASVIKFKIGYPRITITVPSIVIMVPGMFMYKGIYFIGQNNIADGGMWLVKAFLIVLSLPLGLIAARILTDNNFRKSS